MKAWIAILLTIGLIAACALLSAFLRFNLVLLMVLGTSLWAAYDSSRIQLTLYKSGIAYSPVVLFIACALLWVLGFPGYLVMRHIIATGTALLKDGGTTIAA
jgi:hypothetical protein